MESKSCEQMIESTNRAILTLIAVVWYHILSLVFFFFWGGGDLVFDVCFYEDATRYLFYLMENGI